jgi:hypothetical protein
MDKKTKILNAIFWGTVVLSIVLTFYKTIIKQDFTIINYEDESNEVQEESDIEEGTEQNVDKNI